MCRRSFPTLEAMTRLVLLPGMDGTGELFEPFVRAVNAKTQVVRYPASRVLGYGELEQLVLSELPEDEDYVLLGESFSGPIALSIAAKQPARLRGIILCCSFARNPYPGLGILRGLVNWLPDRSPISLLEFFLAGTFSTPDLRRALERALNQVAPSALRARLSAAIQVDVVSKLPAVSVPLLYLRASNDRVVPPSASKIVLEKVPNGRLQELIAPHFLLQTAPNDAARLTEAFLSEVGHAL